MVSLVAWGGRDNLGERALKWALANKAPYSIIKQFKIVYCNHICPYLLPSLVIIFYTDIKEKGRESGPGRRLLINSIG